MISLCGEIEEEVFEKGKKTTQILLKCSFAIKPRVHSVVTVFSRQNHHSLHTSPGRSRSSERPDRLPRAWRAQVLWLTVLPQGNFWGWLPPDTHKKEGLCLSWS